MFGHVAPIFLRRGLHRIDDAGILRAASLSIEPLIQEEESQPLCVTLFEIPVEEVGAFLERVRIRRRYPIVQEERRENWNFQAPSLMLLKHRSMFACYDMVQEEEFEILRVPVEDDAGISISGLACGASTDEKYRELRLGESAESIARHPQGVEGERNETAQTSA